MNQPPYNHQKAAIVTVLRSLADELGTASVPRLEFIRRSGISMRRVRRLFGTYNGLAEAAGLVPGRFRRAEAGKYSSADILSEIARVVRLPDAKLTTFFFEEHSQMSLWSCVRPFGGWIKALEAASHQLDPEREGELLSRIRAYTARATTAARATQPVADCTPSLRPITDGDGLMYGDLIRFRGLEHAPVNELGVILLFGMICDELGYVVEMVKQGFPDCLAKRQVRPGMWQRVRIEFEFRARKFCTHRHNPEQCDVIVCWENDWPDCPIEVVELRSASQRLALAPRAYPKKKDGV
jgi:hypothetical protein